MSKTKSRDNQEHHGSKTHELQIAIIERKAGLAADDRDAAQLAHAAGSEDRGQTDEVTPFPSRTNRESKHNKHNNAGQEHHKPQKHGPGEGGA